MRLFSLFLFLCFLAYFSRQISVNWAILPLICGIFAQFYLQKRQKALPQGQKRFLAQSLMVTAGLMVWFAWRFSPPHLPQKALFCETSGYLTDFPKSADPVGQRFPLTLLSNSCNLPANLQLFATDYRQNTYQLGQVYRFGLTIEKNSLYTTIKYSEPIFHENTPIILKLRGKFAKIIEKRFSEFNEKWIKALLLGDRAGLRSAENQAMRNTGTTHLIAISGAHLVMFWGLAYVLVYPVALLGSAFFSPKSLILLGALALCGAYSLLAGGEAPIVRAWLMLAVWVMRWFVPSLGLKEALFGAGILQLIVFPEDLWRPSAWLSYGAVAFLVVLQRTVKNFSYLKQYIMIQTGISLGLLPLLWALFGGISLLSIPANLLFIPLMPILMYLCILALFFPFLASFADILALYYFSALMNLGGWESAYFEPFWQPTLLTGFAGSALFLLFFLKFAQKRFFMALFLGLGIYGLFPNYPDSIIRSNGYPIGLIKNNDHWIIVNGGTRTPNRDDFRRYFLPILRHHGAKPSALILTTHQSSAHSSIGQILKIFPQTPVYALVPQKENFPFFYDFCPKKALPFLKFIDKNECVGHFGHYEIRATEILKVDNLK